MVTALVSVANANAAYDRVTGAPGSDPDGRDKYRIYTCEAEHIATRNQPKQIMLKVDFEHSKVKGKRCFSTLWASA